MKKNKPPTHIVFTLYNSFLDENIMRVEMPYNKYKAVFGFYTSMYKINIAVVKESMKIHPSHIRQRVDRINLIHDRIRIYLKSGACLDLPSNATYFDLEITQAHLKAAQLKFKEHPKDLDKTVFV